MNSIEIIKQLGINAKIASSKLAHIHNNKKNEALDNLKKSIKLFSSELIEINKIDVENAHKLELSPAVIDRITINENRIDSMITSLGEIIKLKDPVGIVLSEWDRPNGLHIQKVAVPLGVIGVIYESRPNVTVDASAIAIKAGNAVILRGGKDSFHSSQKLNEIINTAFSKAGLPDNTVQMVPIPDRTAVDEMLRLDSYIDVIIPRGGKSLIQKIKEKSLIPVIKHLDGICHVYVDKDADMSIAKDIVFNSKMRRPGICGAAETLLIDKVVIKNAMEILTSLVDAKCEIRGDKYIRSLDKKFKQATEEDWKTEYLDKIISVKIVDGIKEAVEHINNFSSGHTESIITENQQTFQTFYKNINSAIILQNASTQFADGGEFGFGAEIGISTDKLHVRGPVGAEHLTSFKYIVKGDGHERS